MGQVPRALGTGATMRSMLVTALLALVVSASSCSSPPQGITVLAASSLTESLASVAQAWEGRGGAAVTLSFDASSRLAKQVQAGVPADLFVSADEAWMDDLESAGLVRPASRRVLVGNTLVVVVGVDARFVPGSPVALTDGSVSRLALAGESVPAGRYGRAALGAAGVLEDLRPRVVVGDNVRTALAWVATGEASAGVVYATDAAAETRVRVAFAFPAGSYPPIVYPGAVLARSAQPEVAERFLAFCASSEAQAIFAAAGFTPVGGAASPGE